MERESITDHDILIELRAEVKSLREAVERLTVNMGETIKDHETRIRRLELWGAMAIGALTIIQAIVGFLK